jgi:hypothetical protein
MAKEVTSITRTELKITLDRLATAGGQEVHVLAVPAAEAEAVIIGIVEGMRDAARKLRGRDQRDRIRDIVKKAKAAGLV